MENRLLELLLSILGFNALSYSNYNLVVSPMVCTDGNRMLVVKQLMISRREKGERV